MGKIVADGNGKSWVNTIVGVLAFLSAILGGWVYRLENTDKELRSDVVILREHRATLEERVAGMDALVMRLRQQIIDLDVTLQREMRILDETAETRVTEMDRRLQQEMRLLLETTREQLRAIERDLYGKEP